MSFVLVCARYAVIKRYILLSSYNEFDCHFLSENMYYQTDFKSLIQLNNYNDKKEDKICFFLSVFKEFTLIFIYKLNAHFKQIQSSK